MRLTDILDRRVETESGRRLGRVFELRARHDGDGLVVETLLLGRHALVERLGAGRHRRRRRPGIVDEVAWSDVVRIDASGRRIVVRDQ